jgi:hypothetical protein
MVRAGADRNAYGSAERDEYAEAGRITHGGFFARTPSISA